MPEQTNPRTGDEPSKKLVAFYLGKSPDTEGRMIETVWSWSYYQLEFVHDYIQWLFPLRDRSQFNYSAPILDEDVVGAFRADSRLRQRLIRSLELMLRFYGLRWEEGAGVEIGKSSEYPERSSNWISRDNHNYLRLTRIIKSLRILGLDSYAQALFVCLDQIYKEEDGKIGQVTYSYWRDAASNPRYGACR